MNESEIEMPLKIKNVEKSSVVDYPPYISAVIFLGGCNFRCPYCYNYSIIDPDTSDLPDIPEGEFIEWLGERRGKLDAVTISGGEPTVQGKKLAAFIFTIKSMGFKVKLDTNGTNPDILEFLIKNRFLDFVSMDIKAPKDKYMEACGAKPNMEPIERSIKIILESGIDHEFRTTVHPKFHSEEDMIEIAKWIDGAKLYSLQQYVRANVLDPSLNEMEVYSEEWFNKAKNAIVSSTNVKNVQLKV